MKWPDESFSDLFGRLAGNVNATETLKRLRGCVVFKDKEAIPPGICLAKAERRVCCCWIPMSLPRVFDRRQ